MRLAHDDKILSSDDVRRIRRVEIGGVDGCRRNPVLVQDCRFLTRKGKGIRPEDSRPNGRTTVMHRYLGKKNIFTAKALEHYKASVTLNFLPIYGEDPAPTRLLYGNPAVTFIQKTGERPMAAAYFNGNNNRLELLHYFDRRTLVDGFLKRFSEASAAAVG